MGLERGFTQGLVGCCKKLKLYPQGTEAPLSGEGEVILVLYENPSGCREEGTWLGEQGRLGAVLSGPRGRGSCGDGEAFGRLAGSLMSPSLGGADT